MIIFVLLQYISTFINLIRSFIIAILLDPILYGLWSFSISLINYFRYANFGISTFIYYRANLGNFTNEYLKYLFVSFFNLVLPISVIYTFIYYFILINKEIEFVNLYSILFLFIVLLLQLFNIFILKLKIEKRVLESSYIEMIYSFLNFILYIILTYYFSLNGLFFAFLLSLILMNVLIFIKFKNIKFRNIKFRTNKFKIFFKGGVITIIPSFLYYIFIYMDLWLITFYFNLELTGFFALYLTFMNLVIMAPSSISTYLYSLFSKIIKNSLNKTLQITALNFVVSFFVAIIGYYSLEFIISNYLVKYTQSLVYIDMLLYSLPFLTIKNILGNYFIANKKTAYYNSITIFLMFVKLSLFLLLMNVLEYMAYIFYINIIFGILIIFLSFYLKGEKK